jgi:predicted chitinase
MQFDRDTFFAGVRHAFGPFTQHQVDGLNALLANIEADTEVTNLHWVAYMLATVKHETANTYEPIEEFGKGHGRPYGVPVTATNAAGETVQVVYYGRGYVQLTWHANYKKFGGLLGVDLEGNPALALDHEIAYRIMSLGMRKGLFTGRSLPDFIHGTVTDYRHARRIINGMDRADLIAGYAEHFETTLANALVPEQATPAGTNP